MHPERRFTAEGAKCAEEGEEAMKSGLSAEVQNVRANRRTPMNTDKS
jgi:hypothetical protein